MLEEYIVSRKKYYNALPDKVEYEDIIRGEVEKIFLSNLSIADEKVEWPLDKTRIGSTAIVYFGNSQCMKIKKENLDELTEKIYLNDLVNNYKIDNSLRAVLKLPKSFAVFPSKHCVINSIVDGDLFKNLDLSLQFSYVESLIKMVKSYIEYGYYDDDFTPSNIIFYQGDCYNIDLGYIYKLTSGTNPYIDNIRFNMLERMIYKNVMISILRLVRRGISDGFELYKHMHNILESTDFPEPFQSYKDLHISLFKENLLIKFEVDKFLSNYIVNIENKSDNYCGSKTYIRKEECDKSYSNFTDLSFYMIKSIYGGNLNDKKYNF